MSFSVPSLVRANIFQRRTRAAIAILAVAIEVTAVMVLVGLTSGTINEVSGRIQALGADIMFRPAGSSPLLGLSDTTMPEAAVDRLLQVEGVESASPVMIWPTSEVSGAPTNIFGIEPGPFERVGGELDILDGRRLQGGYEIIVDRRLASTEGLQVGQELNLLGQSWTIVGIYRAGIGSRMMVPLSTLQEILGLPNKTHVVFLKVAPGFQPRDVAARINSELPGFETTLMDQYAEVLRENIVGLDQFNGAISSIAVVLSFLVILLAMYTSIIERTREIGILKALGASKSYIMRTIMSESVLLCSIGAAAGVGLAYLTRWALVTRYPTLSVEFTAQWMIYAVLLGLAGGTLGAFYPALRAARQDAVRALRYE
jgi:putative ABC transport system permease protein